MRVCCTKGLVLRLLQFEPGLIEPDESFDKGLGMRDYLAGLLLIAEYTLMNDFVSDLVNLLRNGPELPECCVFIAIRIHGKQEMIDFP